MDVRSMLLGFLMYGNMTGYDLKKYFSISFSFFSGLSYGSIYPALKKMEQEGLISMQREIQDGSPNRKIYSITDAGKDAFIKALRAPYPSDRAKSPFLMRLFFFAHLSPEERRKSTTEYLESIKQIRRELEAVEPQVNSKADYYQYLCYQFGVRLYGDLIRNISQVICDLEAEGKSSEMNDREEYRCPTN